jgi:hypothetical protein
MKTISTIVYSFDELDENIQSKVIEKARYINVDYDWYESLFYDAKNMGIKIQSFDIDRKQNIKGDFLYDCINIADKIMMNCGTDTELYKTSENFLMDRDELITQAEKNELGEFMDVDTLDEHLDKLENEYKEDILQCYWDLLYKEYYWLMSDEMIIDTILANDYQYTEDGILF